MEERLSFWERFKDYLFARSKAETFKDRTTAWVTFAVIALLTYVVVLVSNGAVGPEGKVTEAFTDGKLSQRVTEGAVVNNDFVDLLSDVALIIAASFTTVIGYYFGNRTAENQAKEITAGVTQQLKDAELQNEEIRSELESLRARPNDDR